MRAPCLLALVVLLGGCASDKYGPQRQTWDQASDNAAVAAEPAGNGASGAAGGKDDKLTAADLAVTFQNARACQDAALKYGGDRGEALIRECMHRSDFIDLPSVLAEPWLKSIKAQPALQHRVVEVMARRGGFLEADLPRVAKAGLPLYSLGAALKSPGSMRGSLVIVRGSVGTVKQEKWGTGTSIVAQLDEMTWLGDDVAVRGGGVDFEDIEIAAPERTGRTVFVRLEKREQLRRAADVVVLMTFEGPRSFKNEDGDEEESGIGSFVAAFDTSPKLRH